jgi:hypothetical protein
MNVFKQRVEQFSRKLKAKLIKTLLLVREGLSKESEDTRDMILTYLRFSQGDASKEEMKVANKQFRSFLKTLGLGALAVLPLAPITIPAVVGLGKKLGIDVIPKGFKDLYQQESPKD